MKGLSSFFFAYKMQIYMNHHVCYNTDPYDEELLSAWRDNDEIFLVFSAYTISYPINYFLQDFFPKCPVLFLYRICSPVKIHGSIVYVI